MNNFIENLKLTVFTEDFKIEEHQGSSSLGSFNFNQEDVEDTEQYQAIKWAYDKIGGPKLIKWGDVADKQDTHVTKTTYELNTFGQCQHSSYLYHYLFPHGYYEKPENPRSGYLGFDFKNTNDEYCDIRNFANTDKAGEEFLKLSDEQQKERISSTYYHGAKAHWLIQNIREEGLWNPIQGIIKRSGDSYSIAIHPGSVRSQVFELLNDRELPVLVTDRYNVFDQEPLSFEELIDYFRELQKKQDCGDNISFNFVRGYIECHTQMQNGGGTDFRPRVKEFNKKITELAKGKRLSIYVGYDSRHGELANEAALCIQYAIKQSWGSGDINDMFKDWNPEVKLLDVSKIAEYTREYANQSTEFTYSRFLIPYLENYEGFSIFVDDDYFFAKSPLPFFHFLNPDDAVACVEYDFDKVSETKFNGEKNVAYPKKLWSSFMIFNNAHEDCKKLTPEVVNTESGKYLHQFEWTDKVSMIPERWFITEGTDTLKTKPRAYSIHFTRGGPWIEGMNTALINMLEDRDRLVQKVKNNIDKS